MSRRDRFLVTVSPATLDRSAFADLDALLPSSHGPYNRDWLLARFREGLEIRVLRDPACGFVVFQPGRLCWRPILGAEQAIVVHDLRLAPGGDRATARLRLWRSVEAFARYYGYTAMLAVAGKAPGLLDPASVLPGGATTFDTGPGGARLVGRILQGPLTLPRLPSDWTARAAACGPGVVAQTSGESIAVETRVDALERQLHAHGVPLRRDRLADPQAVRQRAVSPDAVCSVLLDGARLGGVEVTGDTVLRALRARPAT